MLTAATKWSYYPYEPIFPNRGDLYVSRLVPETNGFTVYWLTKQAENVTIYYGKREEECSLSLTAAGGEARITGLEEGVDYQFYLEAEDGKKSLTRLVRTGDYIHTVINYLHPDDPAYELSGRFLCSPSIVRQADGSLLATMDLFAGKAPQNLTLVYRSDDNGATWQWQCELFPCYWAKLFVFHGETYVLSCSTEHGDILLGKTTDGGRTFDNPTVLMRSSCHYSVAGVDMSPEPPIEYGGRVWFNFDFGNWTVGHARVLASAPADSDLLDVNNWTVSAPCFYDENWPGTAEGPSKGTLEGTFMVLPDGKLYIMCRYDMTKCTPDYGMAVLYKVHTDDPAAAPEFYRTVKFDGNHSKFIVQQDERTGNYYTIMSRITSSENKNYRNLLSLVKSTDGINWELVTDLYDFTDKDPAKHGFQYVDYFLEGEDIYYACRTAINGADTYHNSNCILFHVVKNFRSL